MIRKRSRLPRAEFSAGGYRTVRTPYFSLRVKKNTAGIWRVGVIASNAVHKSAAKRNFWKRQAKTVLIMAQKQPLDVLLVLTPKVTTLTRKKFKETIKESLSKIQA